MQNYHELSENTANNIAQSILDLTRNNDEIADLNLCFDGWSEKSQEVFHQLQAQIFRFNDLDFNFI